MAEDQLRLFQTAIASKEDCRTVIKELKTNCQDCRLGAVVHPENQGLVWRGNPDAKIAVISEAPGKDEMISGLPLVGKSGQMWEKWAAFIGLDTKTDCLISNCVQCQPPPILDKKTGRMGQRAPAEDEIYVCFTNRCLRILRAMPNLEAVLTLGWVAARTILGGEPNSKSHDNKWFTTSLLPGVAVYCMVHPSYLVREPSQEKSERVKKGLLMFQREYLKLNKIMPIVKQMQEEKDAHRLQ